MNFGGTLVLRLSQSATPKYR